MEMDAVANIFDRDGDGYIDYREFVAALRPDREVGSDGVLDIWTYMLNTETMENRTSFNTETTEYINFLHYSNNTGLIV